MWVSSNYCSRGGGKRGKEELNLTPPILSLKVYVLNCIGVVFSEDLRSPRVLYGRIPVYGLC
jgi:hypothetical protein